MKTAFRIAYVPTNRDGSRAQRPHRVFHRDGGLQSCHATADEARTALERLQQTVEPARAGAVGRLLERVRTGRRAHAEDLAGSAFHRRRARA